MLRFLRHQTRRWLLVLGVCEFGLLTFSFWLAAHLRSKGMLDPLDNVSVLELFEEHATRWSEAHGGSVVELHA